MIPARPKAKGKAVRAKSTPPKGRGKGKRSLTVPSQSDSFLNHSSSASSASNSSFDSAESELSLPSPAKRPPAKKTLAKKTGKRSVKPKMGSSARHRPPSSYNGSASSDMSLDVESIATNQPFIERSTPAKIHGSSRRRSSSSRIGESTIGNEPRLPLVGKSPSARRRRSFSSLGSDIDDKSQSAGRLNFPSMSSEEDELLHLPSRKKSSAGSEGRSSSAARQRHSFSSVSLDDKPKSTRKRQKSSAGSEDEAVGRSRSSSSSSAIRQRRSFSSMSSEDDEPKSARKHKHSEHIEEPWSEAAAAFMQDINRKDVGEPADAATDQLALAGGFIPFLACNAGYRTRDSLLSYAALGSIIAAAVEPSPPPKEAYRPLVDFFAAAGIDGRLLHDFSSTPLLMGSRNGLWMLQTKAYVEWQASGKKSPEPTSSTVAVLVLSRARLPGAHAEIESLVHVLPNAKLIRQMSAVVSALWSAKRDDISPWGLPQLSTRSDDSHPITGDREISVCLLCAVPLGVFAATPPALRAAALLANPVYTPSGGHKFLKAIVRALAAMGLTRNLLNGIYALVVPSPHAHADDAFKTNFLELHRVIRAAVSVQSPTELESAFSDLKRLVRKIPKRQGYVVDEHSSSSPSQHLIEALETLAQTLSSTHGRTSSQSVPSAKRSSSVPRRISSSTRHSFTSPSAGSSAAGDSEAGSSAETDSPRSFAASEER